jgi:hypothetical protein
MAWTLLPMMNSVHFLRLQMCRPSAHPLDDEVDDLRTCEEDAIDIVPPPLILHVNNDTVIRILEDQSGLRFKSDRLCQWQEFSIW